MSEMTSWFQVGHLVGGSAFSEVGTLKRNHFGRERVLVGICGVSEIATAQGVGVW